MPPVREAIRIEVIRVRFVKGEGNSKDPIREVLQYWSLDGELLAEYDRWQEESNHDD